MALNHKKLNGVRKSPIDHVRLKAMPSPSGEKRSPSSTRSSPRSPRRPITETLQVDVELANSRHNSVSPGRRCVSDSRVNNNRKVDITPTLTRKRKLEFDQESKVSASKFYKSSAKETVCNHGNDVSRDGSLHLELDANQNIKQEKKIDSPNVTQVSNLPSPLQYKSQHRIGRRRAASSFFSYSETTLSSPWKIPSPNGTKSTGVSNTETSNSHRKSSTKGDGVVTCSHVNGEVSSETSSEMDSVFEDDSEVQNRSKTTIVNQKSNPVGDNLVPVKRKVGRPRKSEKIKAENLKNLEDEKVVLPDVKSNSCFGGFRMRRLASLDAETKVHLMFEKEAIQTEEVKKSKPGRRRSRSKSDVSVGSKHHSPGSAKPEAVKQCVTTDLSMNLKEGHMGIPHIPQECNIAGKVTCLNCGSETPAIYVHPPANGDNGLSPVTSVTLAKNRFNLIPSTCVKTSSPISELFNDPDALMRTLSQLAGQRRAPVDSAECDHLKTLFKHRLTCRLSRHSVSEGEMERISSTLANQLSSLINTKYSIPLSPSQTSSSIARQKPIRKVVKPQGLKPAKQKLGRKKSTNGWRGVGDPVAKPIVYLNEAERELRYCYESIKRKEDVIKVRDCVLLRSGTRKKDIPFVAKISAIFEDPDTGEIMVALLWFYRPEHTESGRQPEHIEELFACRHWDINNVACIEDKCYVLPMSEYCRYQSDLKREIEGISPGFPVVPELPPESRRHDRRTFSDTASENVFLCRQVYDYKQRRLLKNPICKFS
ncbi:uncharacterized protein [Apostichopus japonicus]|uniref:uncharacterized protein isoform X2 n=1 Tax=Stichopus japonicus TaxID=307972 RepID=UPI003AB2F69E